MPQHQYEILSTNIPLLKREVTLEYLRRNEIPFPVEYMPHVPTWRQLLFLELMILDVFYGGAAGGGKSDALLMAAAQFVDTPGYNALLIRDTYSNLAKPEGLISRSHDWWHSTDARWQEKISTWIFPSGATVGFGYLAGPRDHFNYMGPAYQFVGIDELVQIREHQARYLFSRMRRLEKYSHVPLRFRCTANPPTKDLLMRGKWVRERYVVPAIEKLKREKIQRMIEEGEYRREDVKAIMESPISISEMEEVGVIEFTPPTTETSLKEDRNSLTRLDPRKRRRAFVPALMDDNPYLDIEEYEISLDEVDYVTRRQLRHGDWEIQPAGRIIDRSWFEIVDSAPVEARRIRFWDLAATKATEGVDPSWTVGVRMSRTKEGLIFVEHVEDIQGNPGAVEALVRSTADQDFTEIGRFPIRMEQEPGSGGKNTIYNYQRNVLPMYDFRGVPATGDKESRFRPFANQVEAGNVYLVRGKWNSRYLDALEALPDAGWDYGDASSGAYNDLAGIDKIRGRIRVIGGREGATRHVQEIQKKDLPYPDQVPIYDRGRLIGYERLTEEDLQRRGDLIPVYDQGVLIRCDRNTNPYSTRQKGIFRPVKRKLSDLKPDKGRK